MRLAVVLILALTAVAAAALWTGSVSLGEAADKPPSAANALAEMNALAKAEASYYAQHKRYADRLADLFANTAFGTDIVMHSGGLDIHVDASTDRQTVILRVNSPAVTLARVLVRGQETGRACEALVSGAICP